MKILPGSPEAVITRHRTTHRPALAVRLAGCLVALIVTAGLPAAAQPPDETPPPSAEDLRDDELAISGRYARFERLLSQMADILGKEDPERAELLRRAVGRSREEHINERITAIVTLLESNDLGSAVEQQQGVTDSLRALLTLLQSEDRRSSVERERERLNELLNDVRGLVEAERSARAATQNSDTPSESAAQQKQVLEQSDSLITEVKTQDAERSSESGESPADGTPPQDQAGDPQEPGDKPQDPADNPKDPADNAEPRPADAKPSPDESPSPAESPSQSPGSPSQPSESQKSEQNQGTPGLPQLEAAKRAMQQALEQLQEQQREKATDRQDEAIAELLKAAGELEEMLRQLREEEKEMVLAALEARFQRMLTVQTQIYEGTVELGQTPKAEWLDQFFGRCRELARQQNELAAECSQVTGLLREDGTSVSILLATEGIEADMQSVGGWLQDSDAGELTQSVQTDIIEALRELIAATQREMEEMQNREQSDSQQQQGEQQKPRLVELMAEIRVLRSLQLRVNRRTKQVDDLLKENSEQESLADQLSELAKRQRQLIESARELARQMESH